MKIKTVTITGADDNTDINEMIRLSEKYPFVEWGILFSPKRIGNYRYPTREWIERLYSKKTDSMKLSAHVCGGYSKQIIEEGSVSLFYPIIQNVWSMFGRIQLNFNATKHNVDYDKFCKITDVSYPFLFPPYIILQYNQANSEFNAEIIKRKMRNIQFLYDSSGGRGITNKNWQGLIEGYYDTGYAGGLTPENLQEELEKISHVIQNYGDNSHVWIDTETGARTNDVLDFKKVEQFLEIASKWAR